MARHKKDGRRATGIQGRSGQLYVVTSHPVIKDGSKKRDKIWTATGLADIAENIKKASEIRKQLLENKVVIIVDRNISVNEYTDSILYKMKREVKDTTYSGYFYKCKKIKDYFGNLRIREINKAMIEKFLDSLFETHELQYRTVKDIKILLSNIFNQAVEDGIIAYNPVEDAVISKSLAAKYSKEKHTDDTFFSYEEAQLFLNNIKDQHFYELFYLTLFFGLRREEILGLRWSAIDFKNKTMSINHTVTKGMTVNRTNSAKNDTSIRKYPLTDEQIEMFIRLKDIECANRELCGNGYYENDYIFKNIDGTLYHPDYPTKKFAKLIRKMPDLPQHITFHGLRKSCVSILVHQGMDIKSIQKWVGHKDINTTLKIYALVKDKESKREISDAMNDIIQLKNYTNQ